MEIRTWQARTAKGITLVQLAALTQLSKSTLNNIENGKTEPTMVQMEMIAKALDVRIQELYNSPYK